MAITVTGSAHFTQTSYGASLSFADGIANTQAGDTLLVIIAAPADDNASNVWAPGTTPDGWQFIDGDSNRFVSAISGNTSQHVASFDAPDGSAVVVEEPTLQTVGELWEVAVIGVRGGDFTSLDVTDLLTTSPSTTSVTPTTAGSLVVGGFITYESGTVDSAVSNSDSVAYLTAGEPDFTIGWKFGVGTSEHSMTSSGGTADPAISFAIAVPPSNTAPNAPNPTYPIGSEDVDVAGAITLLWDFSDPDAGDTQSAYEVEWKVNAGSATSTTKTTSTSSEHTFSAATFSDGDTIEWRAKTWDAADTEGAWSSWVTFEGIDAPAAPTPSSPADEASIAVDSVTLEWTHAGTPDNYEARLLADDAGSPGAQVATSGTQTWNTEHTFTDLSDSTTYHWQVRAQASGLWSSWSTAREFTVTFDAPATPTLAATEDDANAKITWTITNPTPTGDEPDVETWDLYLRVASGGRADLERTVADDGVRVLAGEAVATTTYVDYLPAAGVVYQARAKVYGDNGTSSYSAWTS